LLRKWQILSNQKFQVSHRADTSPTAVVSPTNIPLRDLQRGGEIILIKNIGTVCTLPPEVRISSPHPNLATELCNRLDPATKREANLRNSTANMAAPSGNARIGCRRHTLQCMRRYGLRVRVLSLQWNLPSSGCEHGSHH
jgi:hypothetical protein